MNSYAVISLCLSPTNLVCLFIGDVESVHVDLSTAGTISAGNTKTKQDLAVLMLTSGTTGNPKAVCLHHGQILYSLRGKSMHHGTNGKDVFLNWTGLDHVANLIEIHLHAISLSAAQIHISASEVLADPKLFLQVVHSSKITYTFAPNFFLAALVRNIESLIEQPWSQDPMESRDHSYSVEERNQSGKKP